MRQIYKTHKKSYLTKGHIHFLKINLLIFIMLLFTVNLIQAQNHTNSMYYWLDYLYFYDKLPYNSDGIDIPGIGHPSIFSFFPSSYPQGFFNSIRNESWNGVNLNMSPYQFDYQPAHTGLAFIDNDLGINFTAFGTPFTPSPSIFKSFRIINESSRAFPYYLPFYKSIAQNCESNKGKIANYYHSDCKLLNVIEEETIIAEFNDGRLYIHHINALYNCCLEEISVSMEIEDNIIHLYETEILGQEACNCLCLIDVTSEITDLAPGNYIVKVYGNGNLVGQATAGYSNYTNNAPIADAGPNQNVFIGSEVILSGGSSNDADSDPIAYNWSFLSLPPGSTAILSNYTTVNPSFTTDVKGVYTIRLIVNDGTVDSNPDTIKITAYSNPNNGEEIFYTTLYIKDINGQESTFFANGELIRFEVNILNKTDTNQILTFTSTKTFDFIVLEAHTANIIWRWSKNRGFGDAITDLLFEPGETKTFSVVWNQQNNNGVYVNSGLYEGQGSIEGEGGSDGALPGDLTPSPFCSSRVLFNIGTFPSITDYSNTTCKNNILIDSNINLTTETSESIEVEYYENVLYIHHINALYNCCFDEISVTMEKQDTIISLYETEIGENPCDCLCPIDITTQIENLESGSYTLRIYSNNLLVEIIEIDITQIN